MTGYIIGGIIVALALGFSIKAVMKSVKGGGCDCSGCPSSTNKK